MALAATPIPCGIMYQVRRSRLCALVVLLAVWLAGPASAAEPAPGEVAAWVTANTDIAPAQVALVTADHVYGFERLGPVTATGEALALVRTEAFADAAPAVRGIQSWEAHLLFDCRHSRVRVIRSANFGRRNRGGPPAATEEAGAWMAPSADQPAAKLLDAACDPAFAWPLRTNAPRLAMARTEPPIAEVQLEAPAPTPGAYAVQVARGPSAEGARRALKDAHKALGSHANLVPVTEHSKLGSRDRFTAALNGFTSEAEATQACATLRAAGRDCLVRAAVTEAAAAAAPPRYAVQLAYGPSQEGAALAVRRARKALGAQAGGLQDASEASADGARHAAVLAGFETAGAAARACDTLQRAALSCFARPAAPLERVEAHAAHPSAGGRTPG